MEPEELELQFSPVESSSDSSSYSDTVSITSMSVSTVTESGANKESEPELEAVVEPQVELKLQVSPAGSSDDSDSDIDSDYFDCTDDSNDADSGDRMSGPSIEVATNYLSLNEGAGGGADKSDKSGLSAVTIPTISGRISSCRPVDTISLPQLLLCRLKRRLLYFESAAVSWENRRGLTVPETCGVAAISKKMSVMMMILVVCLCMMSPASAVLAYDSICISNVEKVNFSGREGLVLVPMPLMHQQKTAKWAAAAATAARPAAQPAQREDEQAGSSHKSVEREAAPDGYMKLELLSEILHRVEDKAAKSAAMAVSTAAAAMAAGPAVQSAHKKRKQIGGGHKPEEESPDGPSRKRKRRKARQDGGEDNAGGGDGGDCDGGGDSGGNGSGHYSDLSEARSRMRRYLNWGGWQHRWGSYDVPQSDVALHSVPMEPKRQALASTPAKE
jgi:hypothetical protein